MSKFLDLGIGITIINAYYSIAYFLMWCVELQHNTPDQEEDNEPSVWLAVYTCNLFLNVLLFLGLRKRDRLSIIIWFSLTLLWFIPKLYGHVRGCSLDRRGPIYRIVNVVVEIYVILSFIVMLLIYIYLPQKDKKKVFRYETEDSHHEDDALDSIPMVEILDTIISSNVVTVDQNKQKEEKEQKEQKEQKEELPSSSNGGGACVDQQVSTFDFHRAEECSDT